MHSSDGGALDCHWAVPSGYENGDARAKLYKKMIIKERKDKNHRLGLPMVFFL
jgi:hypothetical protein